MLRIKFSSIKILAAILLFASASTLYTQPLSKRNIKVTFKEQQSKQTLVPFEYANYKKIGPHSKNAFVRIRPEGDKTVSSKILKEKYSDSFFLKLKRHSVNSKYENKSNLVSKKKTETNIFLKQKRHQ
jgi:hypothetical protein